MPPPLHFLVTAGSTRETIDQVRDWGNIFTGNTGLGIARAFLDLGNVTLLTSNAEHAREFDGFSGSAGMMGVETFRSHADLNALLEERMTSGDKIDAVAMTAAVADYQPAGVYRIIERNADRGAPDSGREVWVVENVSAGKVKSHYDQIAIAGTRTPKLIDRFRRDWHYKGILIKFKLEVGITSDQLIAVAYASRTASQADAIVANTLAMARPADGTEGGAYLIDDAGPKWAPRSKLAMEIRNWTRGKMTNDESNLNESMAK